MSLGWRDLLPVPLAAPESPALARARKICLVLLGVLALLGGFFGPIHAVAGIYAVALFAALVAYLAVRVTIYLQLKSRADDAWLDHLTSREDGDAR